MKKKVLVFVIGLMLCALPALALINANASKWSVRGNFDESNVNVFPVDINYAKGKVNAYMTMQRGFQTQGGVTVQAREDNGDRYRLSVRWNSRSYGATLQQDTNAVTKINAKARVIYNGEMQYDVPVKIVYKKNTGKMDIIASDFRFTGIDTRCAMRSCK